MYILKRFIRNYRELKPQWTYVDELSRYVNLKNSLIQLQCGIRRAQGMLTPARFF